jgi:hypothetical protein
MVCIVSNGNLNRCVYLHSVRMRKAYICILFAEAKYTHVRQWTFIYRKEIKTIIIFIYSLDRRESRMK